MDEHAWAGEIKRRAREAGFDLCGIAPAEPSAYRDYYRQWLDEGRNGSMRWLEGRFDERTDPGVYLPGAKSVICVAMNYHVPLEPLAAEEERHHGKVARYALGEDYHELMKQRLRDLADWIRQQRPEAQTRACVDTAPVMEKELAARAGIGWVGKNTLVIHPQRGSWMLLGEVITTLALPADEPAVDRCGTCRRCLEACPTGALDAPYQLDARKCISYLTIEQRQEIDPQLAPQVGEWLYGCDICQEVCPWNRKAPVADEPALKPRFPTGTLDLRQVLQWRPEQYQRTLKNSAMKRVKLPVLQRNAALVLDHRRRGTG